MIKAILKWFLSIFLGCSTIYYIVCRVLNIQNPFVILVTNLINFLGVILNFIAVHMLSILIVVGTAIALWLLYGFIISKFSIER